MKGRFSDVVASLVALAMFGCGHYLPSQGWITFRKLLIREL